MRTLILIIILISLLIILITPGYFRNDNNEFVDIIVVCLLVINSCYLFFYKSLRKVLLLHSFLGLLFCVITTTYGIEDEYRFSRIYSILSISDQQLLLNPIVEQLSEISILLFIILGLFITIKLILNISRNKLDSK
jgi:uncharacterized MnhB-related membrane protein